MGRGCPVEGRRPDCLHLYKAKCAGQIRCIFTVHAGTFAHNPLQKCSRSVLRTAMPFPKDSAARHEVQRAPWVLARAPGQCLANPRWPRRWPPARIPTFLRCPVASSKRAIDNLFSKQKKQFSTSRSIDGSNRCMFRGDRNCVDRIHRK